MLHSILQDRYPWIAVGEAAEREVRSGISRILCNDPCVALFGARYIALFFQQAPFVQHDPWGVGIEPPCSSNGHACLVEAPVVWNRREPTWAVECVIRLIQQAVGVSCVLASLQFVTPTLSPTSETKANDDQEQRRE